MISFSVRLSSDVLIDVLQVSTRRQIVLLEPLSAGFQHLIGQFFSEKPYLIFEEIYCKFGLPDEKCDEEKMSGVEIRNEKYSKIFFPMLSEIPPIPRYFRIGELFLFLNSLPFNNIDQNCRLHLPALQQLASALFNCSIGIDLGIQPSSHRGFPSPTAALDYFNNEFLSLFGPTSPYIRLKIYVCDDTIDVGDDLLGLLLLRSTRLSCSKRLELVIYNRGYGTFSFPTDTVSNFLLSHWKKNGDYYCSICLYGITYQREHLEKLTALKERFKTAFMSAEDRCNFELDLYIQMYIDNLENAQLSPTTQNSTQMTIANKTTKEELIICQEESVEFCWDIYKYRIKMNVSRKSEPKRK